MNIVDLIKGQLGDDIVGKLGSMLGTSSDQTKTAVEAAVPSLLSVLASLASSAGGADTLVNALKQVDPSPPGGFGEILTGPQSTKVQEKGGSLLNILLGAGALPVLLSVLSKFVSLNGDTVKKLLSMLAPFILGAIAKQMSGKGLTSQAVSNFFSEQKSNINAAMPAGLSLASLPSLTPTVRPAAGVTAKPVPAEPGLPGWLLPLLGLAAVAALAWYFLGSSPPAVEPNVPPAVPPVVNRPAVTPKAVEVPAPKVDTALPKIEGDLPEVVKFGTELKDAYSGITKVLSDVKDAATADAALIKLTDVKPKIDGMKVFWDRFPDAGKATITKVTNDNLGKLKELVAKVLAIAGVSDKFKTTVEGIVTSLAAFATK